MRKNLGDEIDQIVDLDGDHVSDFSPVLAPGAAGDISGEP